MRGEHLPSQAQLIAGVSCTGWGEDPSSYFFSSVHYFAALLLHPSNLCHLNMLQAWAVEKGIPTPSAAQPFGRVQLPFVLHFQHLVAHHAPARRDKVWDTDSRKQRGRGRRGSLAKGCPSTPVLQPAQAHHRSLVTEDMQSFLPQLHICQHSRDRWKVGRRV